MLLFIEVWCMSFQEGFKGKKNKIQKQEGGKKCLSIVGIGNKKDSSLEGYWIWAAIC